MEICGFKVYGPGEWQAEAEAEEAALADTLRQARDLGWKSAPRFKGERPAVWLHKDGSWGLTTEEGGRPDEYWWTADRIDTTAKLLGWLAHLSEKGWFTNDHLRQMLSLFQKLHPGAVDRGL
jgi:hypothetical protein